MYSPSGEIRNVLFSGVLKKSEIGIWLLMECLHPQRAPTTTEKINMLKDLNMGFIIRVFNQVKVGNIVNQN